MDMESNWPRCSKCKRYMFMHDPGRGANCQMSVLSKEELEVHDRKILLKRLEKAREVQKKTSYDVPVDEETSQPNPVSTVPTGQPNPVSTELTGQPNPVSTVPTGQPKPVSPGQKPTVINP